MDDMGLRPTVRILLLVAALGLQACAGYLPWGPGPERPSAVTAADLGPLPRATALLDEQIAAAERSAGSGPVADPKRMAHLKMTRAARDLIADGETQRALDLLERAIAVDGREGFGYLFLAELYVTLGDAEPARQFLDRALALLPSDRRLARELDDLESRATALSGPMRGRS